METTNTMLKIAAGTTDQIGYLFLIMTGIYIFYVLVSIEIKKNRINKIKHAISLIENGRKRFEKQDLQHKIKKNHHGGYFNV